ncbi:hypothetical protein DRH27_03380 [Candidatus Falkowbacteria bacterium]|nr:MAG: hypothetical protein DRH27_03380 [Candidatus Falkowbacteria bacterium]
MIKKYYLLIPIVGIFFIFNSGLAATFDPNLIISDEEMLDSTALSLSDISDFLKSKGGYISTYSTKNASGKYMSAAEIIYNAANNYDCEGVEISVSASQAEKEAKCKKATINPKLLLVLLQKEMSLIEETSPTPRQLDWACGYGCPDGQACNTRWLGFGRQVNSAALQFFDYMENPNHYTYRSGLTYTISNTGRPPSIVTPLNQATAALYNYTPHVYNGNYNFYKLWMRYFTRNYPNGTLLQAKGEPGVWLIQNGKKRPFVTKGALTSRFDINKVVQVNKSDLDKYIAGDPLLFPQYSLVRSPRGTVFLIVDDKRRGFASSEAFRKIGYNPEEIIDASWNDINAYTEGIPLTATSTYPTGALLQDNSTGGIFYVTEGTKAPLWSAVLLKTKYKWKSITPVSPEKLDSYTTVEPAIFGDGELLTSDISPAVYVIDNMKKRPITSGKIFEELGYKWSNIVSVPTKILDLYPEGEPISEIYTDEELLIDDGTASSTLDMIGTSTDSLITTTTEEQLAEEVNAILNP